MNLRL